MGTPIWKAHSFHYQVNPYEQKAEEFNLLISKLFSNIKIVVTTEDSDQGDIKVEKDSERFPISRLSTGEREAISLLTYLECIKDDYDVFLIDEPEVHLNWRLERLLFDCLNEFAVKQSKQIIIATHSRVVFDKEYVKKTNFISSKRDLIFVKKEPDESSVNALAGEAVTYIDSFLLDWRTSGNQTFFVEDRTQQMVIEIQYPDAHVIVCGGDSKVESMIRLLNTMSEDDSERKYYGIVDSDNKSRVEILNLLILDRYAIENYFLSIPILASILNKTEEDVLNTIQDFLRQKDGRIGVFKKVANETRDKIEEYLTYFPDAKGLLDRLCDFSWKNDSVDREAFIWKYLNRDRTVMEEIVRKIPTL